MPSFVVRLISLVALILLLLSGMVMAQEAVTVQLDSMGDSGVSGTATLTAVGNGTDVTLDVEGLAPSADAYVTMHAGTCALESASFATLPGLKADANGRATAAGSVLFHGEEVALVIMADDEHIIVIGAEGEVVACGVIPRLTFASPPPMLPATGGAAFPPVAAAAGVFGACLLSAGMFLRQRNRHPICSTSKRVRKFSRARVD